MSLTQASLAPALMAQASLVQASKAQASMASVAGTGDSSEVLCVYGAKQLAFVTVLLNSHRFENI